MKRNGNAEGAEGVGCPLPTEEGAGRGVPLPRKKIDFGSQYGEFWCILDGIFLQFSYLFYTQNRSSIAIGV